MAKGNLPVAHIEYADGSPICADRVMVPDNPIQFPKYKGISCPRCNTRMLIWLKWWNDSDKEKQ